MKIRDYETYEETFSKVRKNSKKQKNILVEERKDQKRYKKSNRRVAFGSCEIKILPDAILSKKIATK